MAISVPLCLHTIVCLMLSPITGSAGQEDEIIRHLQSWPMSTEPSPYSLRQEGTLKIVKLPRAHGLSLMLQAFDLIIHLDPCTAGAIRLSSVQAQIVS